MKITFIGGGNMAKALISGLIKRGYSPSKMHVVEISKDKCTELHNEFGVRATTELAAAVSHAETVILAVKPQNLQEIALQLAPILQARHLHCGGHPHAGHGALAGHAQCCALYAQHAGTHPQWCYRPVCHACR